MSYVEFQMGNELRRCASGPIYDVGLSAATGVGGQGAVVTDAWWPWLHPNLSANPNLARAVHRSRALFARSAPLRKMIVMVDADLRERATHDEKLAYLLRLVDDQSIESHLYADAASGDAPAEGWVRVHPGEHEQQRFVAFFRDGELIRALTMLDYSAYQRVVNAEPPAEYSAAGNPEDRVQTDAIAMLAAREVRADLFLTERPLPLLLGHDAWSPVTSMRPTDAVPVVGLYLRQQGRFLLGASADAAHGSFPVRSVFYWQAAKALVPAASRWAGVFDAHFRATNDRTLSLLSSALIQRVDQALRSRDRLLAALSVPQDIDTMEEALSELDQFLLWVMAAFDVSARVAHITLELPGTFRSAGWQKGERWLPNVAERAQSLAALVDGESDGKHLLKILSLLRNSIHGPALSASGIIPVIGPRALEPLVELPRDERDAVCGAMNALGGQGAWGVGQPFPDHELHLHPGEFVEQALPRALALLNDLVAATPVQRHSSANVSREQPARPLPRTPQETRALWQLGLLSEPTVPKPIVLNPAQFADPLE